MHAIIAVNCCASSSIAIEIMNKILGINFITGRYAFIIAIYSYLNNHLGLNYNLNNRQLLLLLLLLPLL